MFSKQPLDWIQECQKEWSEKHREKEQVSSIGKSNAREKERVCFYDEGEAQHIQMRKKPSPPEHVSFF